MLPVSGSESLVRPLPSSTLPSPVHSRGEGSAVRSEVSTFLGHLRVGTLESREIGIYVLVSGCVQLTDSVVDLLKHQMINWPAGLVNRGFLDGAPLFDLRCLK